MLKAQQSALAQQTNQGTFGGQAAIIGGFAYAALTQVAFPYYGSQVAPDNSNSTQYDDYDSLPLAQYSGYTTCQAIYWVSSAICMAAAMHCILTTIFVQVLGPGLALHGPLGSMARAADGMRQEMGQIFYAYMLMVVSFAISTLFSFWVLMSLRAAIASTVVFAISAMQWWRYCSRIYNKLYLDYDAAAMRDQKDNESEDGVITGQGCEGYLTKKDGNGGGWTRRYFVLTGSGDLYYFKTQRDYEDKPTMPIKERPIEVCLFKVILHGVNEIWLEPKDPDEATRIWQFKCDSDGELTNWKQALEEASKRE